MVLVFSKCLEIVWAKLLKNRAVVVESIIITERCAHLPPHVGCYRSFLHSQCDESPEFWHLLSLECCRGPTEQFCITKPCPVLHTYNLFIEQTSIWTSRLFWCSKIKFESATGHWFIDMKLIRPRLLLFIGGHGLITDFRILKLDFKCSWWQNDRSMSLPLLEAFCTSTVDDRDKFSGVTQLLRCWATDRQVPGSNPTTKPKSLRISALLNAVNVNLPFKKIALLQYTG